LPGVVLAMGAVFNGLSRSDAVEADSTKRSSLDELRVTLEGDSADFKLRDSVGRIAILAIDSTSSDIPDCYVDTYAEMRREDHDDTDTTAYVPDSLDAAQPVGGGGIIEIANPTIGEWVIEAKLARPCRDSCDVNVTIQCFAGDSSLAPQANRVRLASGQSARWKFVVPQSGNAMRLTLEPRRGR